MFRFTVDLVELRRAFRRILARLPDEAEAGTDCVAFNARANVLEILVGDTSEFLHASVFKPGRGRIPLSLFRGVARTLRFFRTGPTVVSLASGMLGIEKAEFRHPEISVQNSTTDLSFIGTATSKPQNL
jgi:hypothetical protein